MIIDVSQVDTFPTNIEKVVFNYFDNMLQEAVASITSNVISYESDVRRSIEKYVSPFSASAYALYDELKEVMREHELICFHSTKILDKNSILKNGLKTNSWETYKGNIRNTYMQLGVKQSKIDVALSLIQHEYERKYLLDERKPQLCFFSGITLLQEDSSAGYEQFCENIGGELARWALKDNSMR